MSYTLYKIVCSTNGKACAGYTSKGAVARWTPEAREKARIRALLRFANKAAERKIA